MADQVFENVVLLAFQSKGLVCDEGLPGSRVQRKLLERNDAHVAPARRAAQDGLDAGEQLVPVEGLCEIVVGSRAQSAKLVGGRAPSRQHEHGRVHALCAQGFQHREAVAFGQHHVEHDEVVHVLSGVEQAFFAVERLVDGVSVPQAAG